MVSGFYGLGFRVWGLGFGVWGFGFPRGSMYPIIGYLGVGEW